MDFNKRRPYEIHIVHAYSKEWRFIKEFSIDLRVWREDGLVGAHNRFENGVESARRLDTDMTLTIHYRMRAC